MVWLGYRFFRKSIWFNWSSPSSVGYAAMQWSRHSGMFLFSKNVTMSSMSLSDMPPMETMTGFFAFAILSMSIQSLQPELAILMNGISKYSMRSTDFSSNGVVIGMQFDFLIASTSNAYSSSVKRVSNTRLT